MTTTLAAIRLLGSTSPTPEVAAAPMPAWAVLALAAFGAVSLMAVLVAVARQERARRLDAFESWVRQVAELPAAPAAERIPAPRHDGRGRPANLRRRRGGEWDTPIVPTVTARPERPERHRSKRV